MIVKVCGLRDPGNIRMVEKAGPDWFGFIFYPRSPRFVESTPGYLPERGRRIGVFVGSTREEILSKAEEYGLWGVQLYGSSPDLCSSLRNEGLVVIRAFGATGDLDSLTGEYHGKVDYFLFDTPTKGYGGSGRSFDRSVLDSYSGPEPFILSGGLNPGSLEDILSLRYPLLAGVDLNSGFETSPGVKDAVSLGRFIGELRDRTKQ